MNTLTVNQEPQLARLSSRRATLERQCSIGTNYGAGTDGAQDQSSSKPPLSQLSSRSFEQSTDDVFGLPAASSSQPPEAQTNSSSADKSTTAGNMPMSKAGRKRKHPVKPGKYICTYCGRPCAKPSVLEKHIRMHTGERPYPCDVCDLSFKTKSNLYKHRKSSAHKQKCKEKGLSMESMFGESFGSSRDESIDMEGDDDSQPLSIPYKRASSVGGLPDRKLLHAGLPLRQPSYMETLQHLEQVYDAIDEYAKRMGTVVCKRAHWLLDKDCIVSIQLQHPPAGDVVSIASSLDRESNKSGHSESAAPVVSSDEVQQRVINPHQTNERSMNIGGRRRLSRQHSVSSPTVQMFNSITPPTAANTPPPPPLPPPVASSSPEVAATSQLSNASSVMDPTSKLPDGEELLKHIRQIIHLNTNIDPNIKLWMHKHCMEVKMKLFIPDVAARRKCSQGLSTDNSIDNQLNRSVSTDQRFICQGCGQNFTREHILEIHSAFFCHEQLPASDNHSTANYISPSAGDSNTPVGNRKKMKLLKTGSEDSYVYVIADDGYNQSKYSKLHSEVPIAAKPAPLPQQSSTDIGTDGGTMKQQLKKHVLKHMSQGSVGTDAAPSSLSSMSDMLSLDKSIDEESSSRQDSSAPSGLPAATAEEIQTVPDSGPQGESRSAVGSRSLPISTELLPNSISPSLPIAPIRTGSPRLPSAISTVILEPVSIVTAPPTLAFTTSSTVSQYVRISPRTSSEQRNPAQIQPTYMPNGAAMIRPPFYATSQISAFIGAVPGSPYMLGNVTTNYEVSLAVTSNTGSSVSHVSNPTLGNVKHESMISQLSAANKSANSSAAYTTTAAERPHTASSVDGTSSAESNMDSRPSTVCSLDDAPPAVSSVNTPCPLHPAVSPIADRLSVATAVNSGPPLASTVDKMSHAVSSISSRPPAVHSLDGKPPAVNVMDNRTPAVSNMNGRPPPFYGMDGRPPALNIVDNSPPSVSDMDSRHSTVHSVEVRPPAVNVMDNRTPTVSNMNGRPPPFYGMDGRPPALNVVDNRPPSVSDMDSRRSTVHSVEVRPPAVNVMDNRTPAVSPPPVYGMDGRPPALNVVDNRLPAVSDMDSRPSTVHSVKVRPPAVNVMDSRPPIVSDMDGRPPPVYGMDGRPPMVNVLDNRPPTVSIMDARPSAVHMNGRPPTINGLANGPPAVHDMANKPPAVSVMDARPPIVSSTGGGDPAVNGLASKPPKDDIATINRSVHDANQSLSTSTPFHNQGVESYRQTTSKAVLLPAPICRKVPPVALVAPSLSVSMCGPSVQPTSLPAAVDMTKAVPHSHNHTLRPAMSIGPAVNNRASTDAPDTVKENTKLLAPAIITSRRDTDRVSSLRRRFSQTRSRSSVSFEDPPVKQPAYLSVPLVSADPTSHVAKVSMKGTQVHYSTAAALVSTSAALSTNTITATSQALSARPSILSNKNVDFTTVYCTVDSRPVVCVSEVAEGTSSYSEWAPSKTPPPTNPWIDMSVPMSCYNCVQRSLGNIYRNSGMDTRSIFTHSSYWQYKNKMRVMQPMPSQPASAASPVVSTEAISTPPSTEVTVLQQPVQLVVSSAPSNAAAVSPSGSASAATSRPSVIARDVPPKKKLLHRSQSTPNAGEESQSKLIAGGFKSDEDYVYIRGRGKGKFVCQQCGIRCRKPSMLKKHIRTHTDLRPYSCKHCNFSFKTKGNLTKHMRSKAHHRRCLELHIVPVPLTVEDNQIDMDILASQQKLSRESKIKGAKLTEQERDTLDGSDVSDDEDDDEDTSDDGSSEDDALHIDESSDDAERMSADLSSTTASLSIASLRRVHSMPAHHMPNSFDASTLAEMVPAEPKPTQESVLPPPKKRKRNHLNLTISMSIQSAPKEKSQESSNKIEDDIAMSLLDLSMTPVHGTPTLTKQLSLTKPLLRTASTTSPSTADVKRVSVVRSTKATASYADIDDNNEPIDLRVQSKTSQLRFICPLCRAICNNQEGLDAHMKLHDGPVIEVPNRSAKRLSSKSLSFGGSFDAESGSKSNVTKLQAPQTPNTLKRQHAVSVFDSDAEEEDVDHFTKVEPGEMLSDAVQKRKCPYCPKVFHSDSSVPQHIKTHHLITQEYVCTYKDCGSKFTNKQDLTYHLGTHALDDNDKYQPISIPKCGICEKTFKSMNSLKQHLQNHSEARPHVCEYCDAGFTTAQSLKHHLKTHTQERPYVCGECGSTFARSDHLTQHSKTHNKHAVMDIQNRGIPQAPTILNPAGAESQHHHNW